MTQVPDDFDDATLMAFADGKLDEPEFSRLVEALGRRPELSERIARLERGAALARELHDAAPTPMPRSSAEEMTGKAQAGTVAGAPPLVLDVPVPERRGPTRFWPLALAAGLAGVLVAPVGYLAGQMGATPGAGAAPLLALDAPIGEPLRRFLADMPSGSEMVLEAGIAARAVTSFVNGAGEVCREFELSDATGAIVGVACAPGGLWQLRLGVAAPYGGEGHVPASGLDVLDAYLATIAAGPPLTGPEEEAALSRL